MLGVINGCCGLLYLGYNVWYIGGCVDYIYRSLVLFFCLYSGSVFADTYDAARTLNQIFGSYSSDSACSSVLTNTNKIITCTHSDFTATQTCVVPSGGVNYCGSYPIYGYVTYLFTCPGGGIVNVSYDGGGHQTGATCDNASACLSPKIRNSVTKLCTDPPIPCSYTEYHDTDTTCAKIPNCHLLGTGSFFDVNTKACSSAASNNICISGNGAKHRYFCPPIDSCVLDTTICSTNADFKLLAANDRAIAISKARVKAAEDKAAADSGVNVAAGSAAAKDAKLAADKAAMAASASDYSNPAKTQEQQAQAKLDYAEYLKREIADKAEAANAWSAYDAAQAANAAAGPPANDVQSQSDPGNSEADSEIVSYYRDAVETAVHDTFSGTGNGTGPGTGTQAGLPSPTDNIVGAVAGLKGSIDGVRDAINNKKTDCELNPTAVGCATLDNGGGSESIGTDEVGITSNHVSWGAGSCPSSVSVSHGVSFDYQPMCTSLAFFKPILISVGLIISLFIVAGGVRD